jgi:acyl-coenzyme A thioesterase PaaI-like protein
MAFKMNPQALVSQAESLGLPVETAQQFYADKLLPRFIQGFSRLVIPFVRRSGVRVEALERGRVVCRMPIKGNVNHIGTMYAGALFTLAEFPGGPLLLATYGMSRYIPIVTSLNMDFVKVAKTDVSVELRMSESEIARVQTETDSDGKSTFELHGELKDRNGIVVARSHAVYQMRPKRR